MEHPAELSLHQFLSDVVAHKKSLSKSNIDLITKDVYDALNRQFGENKKDNTFRLRLSNVGKPTCQLWFQKNKPELAEVKPSNFVMNMMIGDIVEAIFKGLLREAGIKFTDSSKVSLNYKDKKIQGTYDLIIGDAVDDIKSASDWSYKNKFESFDSLAKGDAFGYIGQLAGYAKALDKRAGGWWVVNKANGKFKYVNAEPLEVDKEVKSIQDTVDILEENKFHRCFEPEEELFRGKPTGNTILNKNCTFCDFKHACWTDLIEKPAVMSKAQFPKIVSYVKLKEEYTNERLDT